MHCSDMAVAIYVPVECTAKFTVLFRSYLPDGSLVYQYYAKRRTGIYQGGGLYVKSFSWRRGQIQPAEELPHRWVITVKLEPEGPEREIVLDPIFYVSEYSASN